MRKPKTEGSPGPHACSYNGQQSRLVVGLNRLISQAPHKGAEDSAMTAANRWLLVMCLSWGLVLPIAAAQAQPSTSPAAVLEALGSPDYATRQRATQRLLQDDQLTTADLAPLLEAAATAEQRHRLLAAARHHAIRALLEDQIRAPGPGAIGLTHQLLPGGSVPGVQTAAVQVLQTLPGFPGHAYLEPGDLIVAFDHQPMPADMGIEQFQAMIQARRSGDPVHLTVLRDGQRVTVEFKLANAAALQTAYDGQTLQLRAALRARWLTIRDKLLAATPTPRPLQAQAVVDESDEPAQAISAR